MSTLNLACGLLETRYRPKILLPDDGPLANAAQQANIPIAYYQRPSFRSASFSWRDHIVADPLAIIGNPYYLWRTMRSVAAALSACHADLVVTKGLLAHFYGGWAANRLQLPCIWHVQDEIPVKRAGGFYLKGLQYAAIRWADAIVGDADSITAQFPAHPMRQTIYNGIDLQQYSPTTTAGTLRADLGIPAEALLVGNLARLTDWKGQHVLIEAFGRIAPTHPDLHLVLIGSPLFDNDGYQERLHKMAQASAVAERIHFAGYRTDAAACLAALDLYVHCSLRKDTAPLALLSALATGLPTVITDVDGMVEVVEPGQTALVVAAGSAERLAHALRKLIENELLRRQLGGAARESAEMRFSLEAHTDAMIDVFEMVLKTTHDR